MAVAELVLVLVRVCRGGTSATCTGSSDNTSASTSPRPSDRSGTDTNPGTITSASTTMRISHHISPSTARANTNSRLLATLVIDWSCS